MKKSSNIIIAIILSIVFLGLSINFYFQKYDSLATYLIVLFAGVMIGIALLRIIFFSTGKLKNF